MTLPNLDKTVTKDPAPPATDTSVTPVIPPSPGTTVLTTLVANKIIDNVNEIIDYISGENAGGKIPLGTGTDMDAGGVNLLNIGAGNWDITSAGLVITLQTAPVSGTSLILDMGGISGSDTTLDFNQVGATYTFGSNQGTVVTSQSDISDLATSTKAQFDTALSDGDFLYESDAPGLSHDSFVLRLEKLKALLAF